MNNFPRADIAVYDHDGRLTALAEIKKKAGTSRAWAAQLRRNMLAHGDSPSVPYFLLVTLDLIYLWKEAGHSPEPLDPAFVIEAPALLKPYFDRTNVTPDEVSGPAFELIVGAWLADLARAGQDLAKPATEHHQLIDSGFVDAVRAGRIEYGLAA